MEINEFASKIYRYMGLLSIEGELVKFFPTENVCSYQILWDYNNNDWLILFKERVINFPLIHELGHYLITIKIDRSEMTGVELAFLNPKTREELLSYLKYFDIFLIFFEIF